MTLGADPGELVVYGPLLVAVPVAMAAGLVSFLSPCVLPLLPGYLAYVSGTAGADSQVGGERASGPSGAAGATVVTTTRRLGFRLPERTVTGTLLFVLGFAAVFTSYGAAFGAAGALLITYQDMLIRALGVFTILLGLVFTGTLGRIPLFSRTVRVNFRPRAGVASAPLLGVLFGVGWTPCIGPTLAAVLTLSVSSGAPERGALLSFAYSLGLGIPFLLAALGVQRAFGVFSFARQHAQQVMQAGGILLIVVGLLQVTGVWSAMIASLQGVIAGWQTPL